MNWLSKAVGLHFAVFLLLLGIFYLVARYVIPITWSASDLYPALAGVFIIYLAIYMLVQRGRRHAKPRGKRK
jgi:hypothetical protein